METGTKFVGVHFTKSSAHHPFNYIGMNRLTKDRASGNEESDFPSASGPHTVSGRTDNPLIFVRF